MLYPPEHWGIDPGYQEFKAFVKLQKELLVKSKLQNSRGRTRAAYRAASEQLTPAEQAQAAFDLEELGKEEQEVSSSESELEEGSSFDFLQEGEV